MLLTDLVELEAALEARLGLLQLSEVEVAHAHVVAGDVVLSGDAERERKETAKGANRFYQNRSHGTLGIQDAKLFIVGTSEVAAKPQLQPKRKKYPRRCIALLRRCRGWAVRTASGSARSESNWGWHNSKQARKRPPRRPYIYFMKSDDNQRCSLIL